MKIFKGVNKYMLYGLYNNNRLLTEREGRTGEYSLEVVAVRTSLRSYLQKSSVLQNADRERTNQSTGICLRLGLPYNNNRLLTEREGRTGEYSLEVVAVRISLRSVRTATTEGQYSPVRASSVSKLFIIWHSVSDSKMHFRCNQSF